MSENKVKKVCKECDSESVCKDVSVIWDYDNQEWVINCDNGDDWCNECEGETTIVDKGEKIIDEFQRIQLGSFSKETFKQIKTENGTYIYKCGEVDITVDYFKLMKERDE